MNATMPSDYSAQRHEICCWVAANAKLASTCDLLQYSEKTLNVHRFCQVGNKTFVPCARDGQQRRSQIRIYDCLGSVEARITKSGSTEMSGTVDAGSSMRRKRVCAASSPISRSGWRTVVRAGL